jgi:hypothetical protein
MDESDESSPSAPQTASATNFRHASAGEGNLKPSAKASISESDSGSETGSSGSETGSSYTSGSYTSESGSFSGSESGSEGEAQDKPGEIPQRLQKKHDPSKPWNKGDNSDEEMEEKDRHHAMSIGYFKPLS